MLGYIEDAHGFGLEGVAAMRHRTMDVIRVNSTNRLVDSVPSPSLIRETVTLDTFQSQLSVTMTISVAALIFSQNAQTSNYRSGKEGGKRLFRRVGLALLKDVPLQSLNTRMPWKLDVRQTYTRGIYIKTLLFATHDQVTGSNPEWGDDGGFAKRLGNRQVQFIIQNSVSLPGQRRRSMGTTMVRNFVTTTERRRRCGPTHASSRSLRRCFDRQYLGAGPPSVGSARLSGSNQQEFVGMCINWIGESAPEIGKVLKRKKRQSGIRSGSLILACEAQ